jgi:hypothetical protein
MNLEATAQPETEALGKPGVVFIVLLTFCSVFLVLFLLDDCVGFLAYLFCVGGIQAVITLFVLSIVFGVCNLWPSESIFVRGIAPLFLFNFWLLFFGLIGDFAWEYFVYGKLYTTDPFVDWMPFMVPGNWILDPGFHGALRPGTTWGQMYLAWFMIALPVWGLTIAAYRWTKPLLLVRSVQNGMRITLPVLGVLAVILGIVFVFMA